MIKEECGCGGWIKNIEGSDILLICRNCGTKYILNDGKIKYIDNESFNRIKDNENSN